MTAPNRYSFRSVFPRRPIQWTLAALWLLLGGCGGQPQSEPITEADAARFLEQATWGPNETSIQEVQQKGFDGFLQEQFALPSSGLGNHPIMHPTHDTGCPSEAEGHVVCVRDNYSAFPLQIKFFQNALNGQDQLRQRVAFALSQIFVVSAQEVRLTHALALYQEMLVEHAFGNFRQILSAVTLSPAMGRYLNMVNNDKLNPAKGVRPNENYAREFLQLFSIGVHKLNPDGSVQKDESGRPIPAYGENTIEGFARAFTGWTYPAMPGVAPREHNFQYFAEPMVAVAGNHDSGAKSLLDGTVLPANQTPEQDLNGAITNAFNHSNVGPFICRQLIQHLVTHNPEPAYVRRVANVFNDNGRGVRGDMKAVVRAILLDPEARGDAKTDPRFGKLREPVKFIAGIMRAIGGRSDGVFLSQQSAALGQNVYQAPSVFNFYPPDYPLPGTDLVSPVSAIYTAATALNRANFVHELLYNGVKPDSRVAGATGTAIDLSPFTAVAADPEQLLDKLELVMLHNNMPGTMRSVILNAILSIPASNPLARARAAIYLVATSPQYQAER